jgi:hypothetical protein
LAPGTAALAQVIALVGGSVVAAAKMATCELLERLRCLVARKRGAAQVGAGASDGNGGGGGGLVWVNRARGTR